MELIEHIGIFKNVLSSSDCKHLIKVFEDMTKNKFVFKRYENAQYTFPSAIVDDTSYSFRQHSFDLSVHASILSMSVVTAINLFWACYREYVNKYGILDTIARTDVLDAKLQKTSPQEGYHVWHCEKGDFMYSRRVMAFMYYLNDIEEGGETEFLYQSLRVKPTEGTLLIWPASYTHTHRGNPPLKEDKYVMTGWVEFTAVMPQ